MIAAKISDMKACHTTIEVETGGAICPHHYTCNSIHCNYIFFKKKFGHLERGR